MSFEEAKARGEARAAAEHAQAVVNARLRVASLKRTHKKNRSNGDLAEIGMLEHMIERHDAQHPPAGDERGVLPAGRKPTKVKTVAKKKANRRKP